MRVEINLPERTYLKSSTSFLFFNGDFLHHFGIFKATSLIHFQLQNLFLYAAYNLQITTSWLCQVFVYCDDFSSSYKFQNNVLVDTTALKVFNNNRPNITL